MAPDNHRHAAGLNRLWVHAAIFELNGFALKINHRIGPELLDDFDELITARAPVMKGITASFHFLLAPANANSEINSTPAQPVEGGELFGSVDGVALG